MFGKYARVAAFYYNGNSYDVHRKSVWIWQGALFMDSTGASAASKIIRHKAIY